MIGNAAVLWSTYLKGRRSNGAMLKKVDLITDAKWAQGAIL